MYLKSIQNKLIITDQCNCSTRSCLPGRNDAVNHQEVYLTYVMPVPDISNSKCTQERSDSGL